MLMLFILISSVTYLTIFTFIFFYFNKVFIYTYILLCSFSFIMLLLFSKLLHPYGDLKYDFEKDRLYFFNEFSKTLPRNVNLNDDWMRKAGLTPIIYDKQLVWGIIKPRFKIDFKWTWFKIECYYEFCSDWFWYFPFDRWYGIVHTLITLNLRLASIPLKVIMTTFYTVSLLWQILTSWIKKIPRKVCKFYIHELLAFYPWFKVLVPESVYTYIVDKGILFVTEDLWEHVCTFILKDTIYDHIDNTSDHIILFLTFNIFVEPYYTAFRRIECLVQLLSSIQCMYTIAPRPDRIYTPEDVRGLYIPSFRMRRNPNTFLTRLLSCIFFLFIEHVRVIAIFFKNFSLKGAMSFRVCPFTPLPLYEELLLINKTIFSTHTLVAFGDFLTPFIEDTYVNEITWPIGSESDDYIKSSPPVYIAIDSSASLYVSRPCLSWQFYGGYIHLALADIFFKLDWSYLFWDTDSWDSHKINKRLREL